MEQSELITTNIDGATYTHLPGRDLAKDLKKAQRKWNSKPRALQTPVLPSQNYLSPKNGSLIDRTIDHLRTRLQNLGDDPMRVLIVTLFKPTRPMTHKFNREIELWAMQDCHVYLQYVDPAEWGLA